MLLNTLFVFLAFCFFTIFFSPRRMEGLLWERDQELEREQLTFF